jgi:virulence plasmid B protein
VQQDRNSSKAPSSKGTDLPAQEKATKPGAPRLPSISLPKGGGAIRGIDEKFSVNPSTGTASFSVPLTTSPGRSGFGPQLTLSYDSGSGNGPSGLGWSLSLPSITRKADKGLPRYLDDAESDSFILVGAEDLVPILNASNQRVSFPRTLHNVDYTVHLYRPRTEGLFARIERWARVDNGVSHWRTITRDNVTTIFGSDENSRIVDTRGRAFSYLIRLTFDDKGCAV